jgi:site-specific recombinase XerD
MANVVRTRRMNLDRPSRRLDADLLTPTEVEQLLRACSSRAPTGIRNRALIALAWRCGLRIGEILALKPKDLDLATGTLVVQHGKGDKRRAVGVDAGTAALIERWLSVREKRKVSARAPVFCTLSGGSIDQSYVRHLLPRLARKAGIEKRTHAHGLRHAFAVELEREGGTITTIRDLLGHSSAAVTDRYLRRLGTGEAIEFARRRSWSYPTGSAARSKNDLQIAQSRRRTSEAT